MKAETVDVTDLAESEIELLEALAADTRTDLRRDAEFLLDELADIEGE